MTTKKRQYYVATTGFFDHKIKICFNEQGFQEALKDAKITAKHSALDLGVAESHIITQDGTQNTLLAIVFDLDKMQEYDSLEKIGIIVHECVHTVTHVFEHVGEDEAKVGDETRAYFTENLFKQVFAAFATEEDKRARKASGSKVNKANKGPQGSVVQMDQHGERSSGQNYHPSGENISGRTQNSEGLIKSAAKNSI
jgi:hypothetical protein